LGRLGLVVDWLILLLLMIRLVGCCRERIGR
jgi:hypothetical protein